MSTKSTSYSFKIKPTSSVVIQKLMAKYMRIKIIIKRETLRQRAHRIHFRTSPNKLFSFLQQNNIGFT
jgi:hypothetical protein